MIARGKNASDLFPAVVKNVACKNIEVCDQPLSDFKVCGSKSSDLDQRFGSYTYAFLHGLKNPHEVGIYLT